MGSVGWKTAPSNIASIIFPIVRLLVYISSVCSHRCRIPAGEPPKVVDRRVTEDREHCLRVCRHLWLKRETGSFEYAHARVRRQLIWSPKNGHHEVYYLNLVENL